MKKPRLGLTWTGLFIELCLGRITREQKKEIDARCPDLQNDFQREWYDNTRFLKRHFSVDNWWSIDDLDHAMGLVFTDRPDLHKRLATMTVAIDETPATIDPASVQLRFYAPETLPPTDTDQLIIYHGARRDVSLHLSTEFAPPFDPSLITLSLIQYPYYGTILIDLDYDGYDDVAYRFGETTYLKPRILEKEAFDDTSK